jgi:hypothetical protein
MFSSTAAFDPTFWPLHGAMERMADLKRVLISQGEITDFDDTWGFKEYSKDTPAAYLDGVCDWSRVAGAGDLTLPECTLGVTCFGHNENDLLEFSGFLDTDDAYTNGGFWALLHPWSDALPYTYDTFEYDYCADDGYDFYEEEVLLPPLMEGGHVAAAARTKSAGASSAASVRRHTVYKGFAPGQSQPEVETLSAPASLRTQTVAETQRMSEALQQAKHSVATDSSGSGSRRRTTGSTGGGGSSKHGSKLTMPVRRSASAGDPVAREQIQRNAAAKAARLAADAAKQTTAKKAVRTGGAAAGKGIY